MAIPRDEALSMSDPPLPLLKWLFVGDAWTALPTPSGKRRQDVKVKHIQAPLATFCAYYGHTEPLRVPEPKLRILERELLGWSIISYGKT